MSASKSTKFSALSQYAQESKDQSKSNRPSNDQSNRQSNRQSNGQSRQSNRPQDRPRDVPVMPPVREVTLTNDNLTALERLQALSLLEIEDFPVQVSVPVIKEESDSESVSEPDVNLEEFKPVVGTSKRSRLLSVLGEHLTNENAAKQERDEKYKARREGRRDTSAFTEIQIREKEAYEKRCEKRALEAQYVKKTAVTLDDNIDEFVVPVYIPPPKDEDFVPLVSAPLKETTSIGIWGNKSKLADVKMNNNPDVKIKMVKSSKNTTLSVTSNVNEEITKEVYIIEDTSVLYNDLLEEKSLESLEKPVDIPLADGWIATTKVKKGKNHH